MKNIITNVPAYEIVEIKNIEITTKYLNIFILPFMKISMNCLSYSNSFSTLKFNAVIRNYLWWALEDLNLGPLRYERSALTN